MKKTSLKEIVDWKMKIDNISILLRELDDRKQMLLGELYLCVSMILL